MLKRVFMTEMIHWSIFHAFEQYKKIFIVSLIAKITKHVLMLQQHIHLNLLLVLLLKKKRPSKIKHILKENFEIQFFVFHQFHYLQE
jgi:hypothetical protein